MRKALLAATAVMVLPVAQASASLLLYEGFNPRNPDPTTEPYNYQPGELLASSPDPSGGLPNGQYNIDANQHWRRAVGTTSSTANAPGIRSGSLSYSGLPDSVGNRAVIDSTQNTALARIAVPGGAIATNDIWYWSGIVRITNVAQFTQTATGPTNGHIFAGFSGGTGPSETTAVTTFAGHLAVSRDLSNTSQYYIGSGVNNNNKAFATSKPLNDGDVVFMVVSYTRNSGALDDVVKLWINPDSSTFDDASPPAEDAIQNGAAGGSEISPQSFMLRTSALGSAGNRPEIEFDELRIGTTWADVTPVPEPTAVAVLGLGAAGLLARRRRA